MTRSTQLLPALVLTGGTAALVGWRAAEAPRPEPRADRPEWVEVIAAPDADVVVLRSLAKRDIAREAAAGDRSLSEAAALFGELNRLPPATPLVQDPGLPGGTEGERLCRQVIRFASVTALDWPPARADAAVARLEAELRDEFSRDGGVRRPDPAGLPAAADFIERTRARLTDAQRRAWLRDENGVGSDFPW